MHIEPGFVAPARVMLANATALGVLACYAKFLKKPMVVVKTILAAVFFSVFMQVFHLPIGPSELHFTGGIAIYLTLGFVPTLFGFGLGLLLQSLFFAPADLMHLAVNTLSLVFPLLSVHYSVGRHLSGEGAKSLSFKEILKLDAIFYTGVTMMVGFWLLLGNGALASSFAAWFSFASSYLAMIAFEPIFSLGAIRLLKRYEDSAVVKSCFEVNSLRMSVG